MPDPVQKIAGAVGGKYVAWGSTVGLLFGALGGLAQFGIAEGPGGAAAGAGAGTSVGLAAWAIHGIYRTSQEPPPETRPPPPGSGGPPP